MTEFVVIESPVVADIDANGSDDPVTISEGDMLAIDLSFDAGSHVGESSEYYLVVVAPFGILWLTGGGWIPSLAPITLYQGPLVSIPRITLGSFVPPAGLWIWFLIVDDDTNGVINGTWWDMVAVTVESGA